MYVHVQVCHFGSLLTICVPGVRGYLSISIYLSIAKAHACHAKATGRAAETKERQRDTGGIPGRTSDPFAVHQVPRLPRTSHRQSGGDQGTPEGHRGVHPIPLQCTKSRTCHAKATGRAAETKGHRRDTGGTPEGHRVVHPTSLQCTKSRLPRKSHRPEGHRGVHPTPLQCTKSHACHAKATGRAAETKGHRRDTHPTPLQKPPAERRRPRDTGGTPGRTSDPFAVHQVSPATQKPPAERRRPRDTGGTLGRTSGVMYCL